MKRAAVTAAAAVAALVAAAAAGGATPPGGAPQPTAPAPGRGGEGIPLKTYASITPRVHMFGDAITARLAIVADTRRVDPAQLRISAGFSPYRPVHAPTVKRLDVGRFAQLTWTWTLRCLTPDCVPQLPPSDKYHVFNFDHVHIDYPGPRGKKTFRITATWPPVEVLSQVAPGVVALLKRSHRLDWQFHITPVASPTYRVSPSLLFWLVLAAGTAVLLAAALLGRSWYRTMRPHVAVAPAVPEPMSPLERALALLVWAHDHGDETLQRKALERVAGELLTDGPRAEVGELSRTARELAWSAHTPEDEEVETFTEKARETGRPAAADEVRE